MPQLPRRLTLTRAMALVALTAGLLGLFAPVSRRMEWVRVLRQIDVLIDGLRPTQPNTINPSVWDCARGAVKTAYANICFSPEHTSTAEMYRLRDDLEVKLQGPIDLETLRWLWARLGQTGPHGKQYIQRFDYLIRPCLPDPGTTVNPSGRDESRSPSL